MTPIPINEHGIVRELEEFIADYSGLPQSYYYLPVALWALATHCYRKFDAFGYLNFTSEAPGAGKTRCLEVLECICHAPKLRSKVTLAAMCALVEAHRPTLLIDQAERLSQTEHNDLLACILSGYRAGLPVTVQYKNEAMDREIYCPKAFALVGHMMDAARDRSIVIPMRPARTRKRWRRSEARERGEEIGKRCGALMEERSHEIDDAIANFPGLLLLLEREDEIWTPLFTMCDLFCPERRTELERTAADLCAAKRAEPKKVSRGAGRVQTELRDGERLLYDLLHLCVDHGIRTKAALEGLKRLNDAPWRNYAGEGLTDMKIADLLRPYGVRSRQIKSEGQNLRGYARADLAGAMERLKQGATSETETATPLPDTEEARSRGAGEYSVVAG